MRNFLYVAVSAVMCVVLASPAQSVLSIRIPEATLKAGKASNIEVHLPHAFSSPYPLLASASYRLVGVDPSRMPDGSDQFSCEGNLNSLVTRGQDVYLILSCNLPQRLKGGEYRPEKALRVYRMMQGEDSREYPDLNLPFLTVEELPPPPPPPPTTFPDFDGVQLALDVSQSFSDGATRIFNVLTDLSVRFPSGMKGTRQNRAYLLAEAKQTKLIFKLTRVRYERAKQIQSAGGVLPSEVMFDDLNGRLDEVIKGLGAAPFDPPVSAHNGRPHFALAQAQLPKTSDSIDAQTTASTLNKHLALLIEVITDAHEAFERIGLTTQEQFSWSIITNPSGAKIYYRRFHHPEELWAGQTNLTNQASSYARWTFRFDWDGCSIEQSPNPYRQSPLNMTADKKDCKWR